jgi:hypothetical protein
MTLVQHSSGPVLEGNRPDRMTAATAVERRQEDLAEVVATDAKNVRQLARQLRDEWRRERYSRLKAG